MTQRFLQIKICKGWHEYVLSLTLSVLLEPSFAAVTATSLLGYVSASFAQPDTKVFAYAYRKIPHIQKVWIVSLNTNCNNNHTYFAASYRISANAALCRGPSIILPSVLTSFPFSAKKKQPRNMMRPLPCFTASIVC
ncbi:hypothetical protein ILYODFUR_013831 [Ilyodon furcidens]|uniref:Uncharacterized protein n=1 Tax=Ilyodon furcidens TaxID=33524 RepID=A0ABV0VDT1_9TELE